MKILILLILLVPTLAFAQSNKKISDYPADSTPTTDDLLLTVDSPASSPANKRVTVQDLLREPNLPSTITRDSELGFTDLGSTVYLTVSEDNVGIGTTVPIDKLSVVGDISSSGKVIAGGKENRIRAQNFVLDFDDAGKGILRACSFHNSNNECLDIDLENTANTAAFSGLDHYKFEDALISGDQAYFGGAIYGTSFDVSSAIVSYYRMEQTSGTSVTDNQAANTGTSSVNLTSLTVPGKIGNGFEFDGIAGEYIDLGSNASLKFTGDFSVAFWIKTTQSSTARIMGNRSASGNNIGYEIFINSTSVAAPGAIGMILDTGSTASTVATIRGSTIVNTGGWFHCVFVRSGSSLLLYINSISDAEPISLSGDSGTNAGNTYIGRTPLTASYFSGTLDNVQYFNRALTEAEVTALYNSAAGTESLSQNYTDLDSQVIGATDPVTSDFAYTETASDLIVQGKVEIQDYLYLSTCRISKDSTGATCTETCTQSGDEPSSPDSDCIADGVMDN